MRIASLNLHMGIALIISKQPATIATMSISKFRFRHIRSALQYFMVFFFFFVTFFSTYFVLKTTHSTTKKNHKKIVFSKFQIWVIVLCSELPICPPPTNDQMPSSWWIPKCCDKSLLVGTYKHGCENYRPIRCDPALCFVTHLGPGDDTSFIPA